LGEQARSATIFRREPILDFLSGQVDLAVFPRDLPFTVDENGSVVNSGSIRFQKTSGKRRRFWL
jgi:hypothetical protein